MTVAIYWFQRDQRLDDNEGLAAALANYDQVIPVYVTDPEMIPGGDMPAIRTVLWRSLHALDAELQTYSSRLIARRGDPAVVIPELVKASGATAVYAGVHPGRKALARHQRVATTLAQMGVRWQLSEDDTIVPANILKTGSGGSYTVFTPFSKKWLEWIRHNEPGKVSVPLQRLSLSQQLRDLPGDVAAIFGPDSAKINDRLPQLAISRDAALERLAYFTGVGSDTHVREHAPITRYNTQRDLPAIDGTSRLSVHLAWGTLSARSAYLAALATAKVCTDAGREGCRVWVNELIWRDFYHHLFIHSPHAETEAYQQVYNALGWEDNEAHFAAWCEGRTGYPIVDAAMRQMNQIGWMHNRARMITASFLVKDLLLNWQLGESYFAQQLIDYDVASNNGGWQWSASTGTDAQPYFRVFNPSTQGERYDSDGAYVRQWIPELAKVPKSAIHSPWKLSPGERRSLCPDYPPPIVDHATQRPKAIEMFVRART